MILFPVIHILVLTFEMTDATHIPVQVVDILTHRVQYQNMIRPVCQIANTTSSGQPITNISCTTQESLEIVFLRPG